MINIALLTGRGGSSLVDKNIRLVAGKPVLSYPCIAANHSGIFEDSYCSSDDNRILEKALDFGFKKIIRPDYLTLRPVGAESFPSCCHPSTAQLMVERASIPVFSEHSHQSGTLDKRSRQP